LPYNFVRKIERDRRRGEREFIRFPVADLEIKRTFGESCVRNQDRRDQFARCERGFNVRRGPRQFVQICKRKAAEAVAPPHFYAGVERDQSLREIARIGRNAMAADAENCVPAD
jgi:hypothetical protein